MTHPSTLEDIHKLLKACGDRIPLSDVIYCLGWSVRTSNVLKKLEAAGDIKTLRDLQDAPDKVIRSVPGCGQKSLAEIREVAPFKDYYERPHSGLPQVPNAPSLEVRVAVLEKHLWALKGVNHPLAQTTAGANIALDQALNQFFNDDPRLHSV